MSSNKVPYTPEHERLYSVLVDIARKKQTISYTELLKKAKISLDMSIPYDRGRLGNLLGEISWNETQDGRPMLSSVAIHAGGTQQGQGFYDLAEVIYKKKFRTSTSKLDFGITELKKTYEYWSKN